MTQENTTTKPNHKTQSGAVTAAIYVKEYQGKDGKPFQTYDVQFSRSYTKDDGKTYQYTKGIDRKNLDNLIIAAKGAKEWIALQEEA